MFRPQSIYQGLQSLLTFTESEASTLKPLLDTPCPPKSLQSIACSGCNNNKAGTHAVGALSSAGLPGLWSGRMHYQTAHPSSSEECGSGARISFHPSSHGETENKGSPSVDKHRWEPGAAWAHREKNQKPARLCVKPH